VSGGWVTQADRKRWQRDAVRELAAILDAHPGLPLIAWAVGQSGGVLSGRIAGPVPGAGPRAAFTAWQQALGLQDVLEVPAADGRAAAWLRATTRRGSVRITVTAMVPAAGADAAVTS
jgi:hypothetical protein